MARRARSDRFLFHERPAVAFEVLFWMLILFHEGYITKREEKVQEAPSRFTVTGPTTLEDVAL